MGTQNRNNFEIWLLLDSRHPGGIETHVFQLADGLNREGVSVSVIFLNDHGPHPLRDMLEQANINTRSLNGSFIRLYKELREERPLVLHTHGYKAGIFGRFAAKLCGIPTVSTFHAGEIPSGKLKLYDWLDRYSAVLATKNYAVSPLIAKSLPVRSELFDNFVNTDGLEPSEGEEIAFVGRISFEKGPDYFLQLAKELPQQTFHIYGDGPLFTHLQDIAGENVRFHGQQKDMSPIWSRIGLLVMPSRQEGLPMASLEAMARGIPVLASNVGALDQLIDNDINGWLIDSGDIDELVRIIKRWTTMTKQEKVAFQTSASIKVQQRYSASIVIPKLIQEYRQIAI